MCSKANKANKAKTCKNVNIFSQEEAKIMLNGLRFASISHVSEKNFAKKGHPKHPYGIPLVCTPLELFAQKIILVKFSDNIPYKSNTATAGIPPAGFLLKHNSLIPVIKL
jgi:hypothetical protein